jgi:PKD repeat protein
MSIVARVRRTSRGQSMAEFALILPVLLMLLLIGIDFARVYLGWVNLQNMTRIAASFAANNPSAWDDPGDAGARTRYLELVANESKAINCDLTGGVRDPEFVAGTELGDPVDVAFSCQFPVLTPVISQVLGGSVLVSASASAPVRFGFVAGLPGGGGPVIVPPEARFVASPRSGYAPLTVQFTDASINAPTSWTWSFQGATTGSSLDRDPTATWNLPGVYTVALTAQNAGGSDTLTETGYVEVFAPPTAGAIPGFTANPRTGNDPLAVNFTDQSTGATTWAWTFGDGGTSTQRNPNHPYALPGPYDVSLTVSDGTAAPPNTLIMRSYILVDAIPCRVPNFFNTKKNAAQGTWAAAGFTTNVQFASGGGNYTIKTQTLAGTSVPAAGCDATITVGP